MNEQQKEELEKQALILRCHILRAIRMAGSGHLAGSLDISEVLVYFYHQVLRVRPTEPEWPERDLFLLSAGHLCPAWYAMLAQLGYFPVDQLLTLRQFGSSLQGHPKRQPSLGIENSAGPLGQGVSMAVGMAYQLQQEQSGRRVFVLGSDGEQDEGQCWESYLFAAHYNLSNLTLLMDVNGIQQTGNVTTVMDTAELKDKLLAFGWAVAVVDGNDFASIESGWQQLKDLSCPKAMLCRTIPGKGITLLENDYHWHAQQPTEEQWTEIFAQLETQLQHMGVSFD